ncbi:MAG: hypothetical protein NXI22_07025 [bacterium]|nr:hypothetical protein [bacterium]
MTSTFFCPQCKTHCVAAADGLGNHYCESCEEPIPHDVQPLKLNDAPTPIAVGGFEDIDINEPLRANEFPR